MKRVLVVFPCAWDEKNLAGAAAAPWRRGYDVVFAEPRDEDCPWDFDLSSFIERSVAEGRGALDGVFSSSDYPGPMAAAAIAAGLGLPGPPPGAVIRAAHKYYSRLAQREAAPGATPGFHLVDPRAPRRAAAELSFPCFVKPVKGTYSILAREMQSLDDLEAFLTQPAVGEYTESFLHIFDGLLRRYPGFEVGARHFIAEDLLRGRLVTVEGFIAGGDVEILGVVDSILHPGTRSFARFEYPSSLGAAMQERLGDIARRVIRRLGLERTLFNLEMMVDLERDRIGIVEVNPRMCGQFADLYEKVDGVSGYEIALALAAGEKPPPGRRRGAFAAAASVPLRVFHPARVARAPGADDVRAAEALYPGTHVWTECRAGDVLADFGRLEDGESCRYGVINLGAPSREELPERAGRVRARLGFELTRSS